MANEVFTISERFIVDDAICQLSEYLKDNFKKLTNEQIKTIVNDIQYELECELQENHSNSWVVI